MSESIHNVFQLWRAVCCKTFFSGIHRNYCNVSFSGDRVVLFSGDWKLWFWENYNTSAFGRLKCVVLRRLKFVIFRRLKCIIFGRLQFVIFGRLKCINFGRLKMCHFREIEMYHFRKIKMCHFWEIKISYFRDITILPFSGGWNFSSSEDWNVSFSGNWIVSFSRYYNTSIFGRLKFVFSRDQVCNFREIKMFFFSGDWTWHFGGIEMQRFREMKKLNCPVSGKRNPSFSSAEITRIRSTENLNLKQSVNQSTPEVLPMLTRFVMRYNQPGRYWTSYLWKLSPKSLQIGFKNTSRWVKMLIV